MKRRSARPFSVEIIKRTRATTSDPDPVVRAHPGRDIWRDMLRQDPAGPLQPPREQAPASPPQVFVPPPEAARPARRVLPSLLPDPLPSLAPAEPQDEVETAARVAPTPRRRGRPPRLPSESRPASTPEAARRPSAPPASPPPPLPAAEADTTPAAAPARRPGPTPRSLREERALPRGERWKRRLRTRR